MVKLMEKKMTIAMALEMSIANAIAVGESEDSPLVTKLRTMMEQNAKRSTKSGEPTAKQKENMETAEVVYDFLLAQAEPVTVGEILKGCNGMSGMSSSKMTAIVKILVKDGRVKAEKNSRGRGIYSVA